ncbi:junctional adhesion molecule A-like [Lepisosteus oculatus]|uniref:junctional adhesion molecule A-like n=1 Tax=Lepisosteus oculatus TaxID=7918 RepID=UPI0035F52DB6
MATLLDGKPRKRVISFDMVTLAIVFVFTAGTASGLSVTTNTPVVQVPENSGADLNCQYSADFVNPRVEWKYKDKSGSQVFLFYDSKPTAKYGDRIQLLPTGLRFSKVTRQDNGEYTCDVSSKEGFASTKIQLVVQVPPSIPKCYIPASVTTGSEVTLTCYDGDGSPPSTYKWYNGSTLLPENPKQFPAFANSSYVLNPKDGTLKFPRVSKADSGKYYCTAQNGFGNPASCDAVMMVVKDVNTGGIVAGVIVALLFLLLLGFGLWYAYRKGYLPKKSERKPTVLYSQPPVNMDEKDGEFRQKSSFVV